jgi:Domain of unknown function (DUF4265)
MINTLTAIMLKFPLDVEDDWPPFAVESIPFAKKTDGYQALSAPLFIKNLSVDDLISVEISDGNTVESWQHIFLSKRTTIWLLRLKEPNQINSVLARLRDIGCNTVGLAEVGCYAIDVPETIPISQVDSVLEVLTSETVAIAFPSMRHPD